MTLTYEATIQFLYDQDRGIVELQGWTIAVEEGGDTCAELSGGDFVLDGIGELVTNLDNLVTWIVVVVVLLRLKSSG